MPQLDDYLKQLEARSGARINLGLAHVKGVAEQLDLSQPNYPVITVAGTNGKGSCVTILAAILQAAGYKTGVYTSPHIWHFNERIQIDGMPVADALLVSLWSDIETIPEAKHLSYFEFTTVLALAAFKQAQVDVMILEVGLGGRLDAVNIIDPTVAVITRIGLDHQAYLGEDRESIAAEKAGIFRSNGFAVCGDADCPQAIRAIAQQKQVNLACVHDDFQFVQHGDHWSFAYGDQEWVDLPVPKFALSNAAAALMALQYLPLPVSHTAICQGLSTANLPGRFQIEIRGAHTWIHDVAHNPQAAELLFANLTQLLSQRSYKAIYGVFSALADKDIPGVIAPLASVIDRWYIAPLDGPRAASLSQLQDAFTALAINDIQSFESIPVALRHAEDAAQQEGLAPVLVVVFGSFYVIKDSL